MTVAVLTACRDVWRKVNLSPVLSSHEVLPAVAADTISSSGLGMTKEGCDPSHHLHVASRGNFCKVPISITRGPSARLSRSASLSPPRFRHQEFPSLWDSIRLKSKKKSFGPTFDTTNRDNRHPAQKHDFPFEEIADHAIKLKSAPIRLQWATRGRSKSIGSLEGRGSIQDLDCLQQGQN